jgi:cytochrome c-type biogenesis protein
MTYVWAYLAGLLTLINPCVLPLLPLVLASAFQGSRFGPVGLAAGLVFAFTTIGVLVTAFGHAVGISEDLINRTAAGLMMLFGVVLLVPRAQAAFALLTAPFASSASQRADRVQPGGLSGQVAIGVLLGAVMLTFGIGVATVLLLLAYGSREMLVRRHAALSRWLPYAKPIMGTALLLVGALIFFHIDRAIDRWLLQHLPIWLQDLSVAL